MTVRSELLKSKSTTISGSVVYLLLWIVAISLLVMHIGLATHMAELNANMLIKCKALQYDIVAINDHPDLTTNIKLLRYGICKRSITLPEAPLFNRWGPPLYVFPDERTALRGWMKIVGNSTKGPDLDVMQYRVYTSIIGEIPNL